MYIMMKKKKKNKTRKYSGYVEVDGFSHFYVFLEYERLRKRGKDGYRCAYPSSFGRGALCIM